MTSRARPVTVITGAGRGIGASTALHLAAAGHDLAIGYRTDRHAAHVPLHRPGDPTEIAPAIA